MIYLESDVQDAAFNLVIHYSMLDFYFARLNALIFFFPFFNYKNQRSFFALSQDIVNSSFSLECSIRSCWMLNSNCKICCILHMMSNLVNARISLASPELTYRLGSNCCDSADSIFQIMLM
ncbi:hypothetical protein E2542_SST31600 [Spatholobus suberectus]|nr:hypothetical protein E2542_SST31600 [Spatholobus suberectus]